MHPTPQPHVDLHFLSIASAVSTRSKDPSTKTGAVIVDPDGIIVSTGYNGFPRRMLDRPELYADRAEKLARTVHCEMNALIFARRDLTGCTLYTWPFLSCGRCAVHVIQSGIVRFVAPLCPPELSLRWADELARTRLYAQECCVACDELALSMIPEGP